MGKDSKQRTKGGVQPSNASRAAKLLEKTGGTPPVLNSFLAASAEARGELLLQQQCGGGVTTLLDNSSPVHSSLLLVDDELPPEVRVVFRKLLKKDGTTKIKALSELSQLIDGVDPTAAASPQLLADCTEEASKEELCSTVLPHWSKLYPKLTQDESRKVRELAQTTHTLVCKAVGRNLAKHLKYLMPYWFVSQFDLYGPVASAAQNSLHTVFPAQGKRVDALRYCLTEVLGYLMSVFETVWVRGEQGNNEGDLRVVVGGLCGVIELVQVGLVEREFVNALVGGKESVFWRGVWGWESRVVRKPALEMLNAVLCDEHLTLPSQNLSKLVNSWSSGGDVFVQVWGLVETLCQLGRLPRDQVRGKVLGWFNSSLFHVGSQIRSVTDVVRYCLEDSSAEFLGKFVASVTTGVGGEKSGVERIALVKHFVTTVSCLDQTTSDRLVMEFVVKNLSNCVGVAGFITASRGWDWFQEFCAECEVAGVLDSVEFGGFLAGVACGGEGSVSCSRRVMFKGEGSETEGAAIQPDDNVKDLVGRVVEYLVVRRAFIPVALISKKIGGGGCWVWDRVDPASVCLEEVQLDKNLKLHLALELVRAFPNHPKMLAYLSVVVDEEEQESMVNVLREILEFMDVEAVGKWVRMEVFVDKLERLISETVMTELDWGVCVRFILRLGSDRVIECLKNRVELDQSAAKVLSNVVVREQNVVLEEIYACYLDKYFGGVLSGDEEEWGVVCRKLYWGDCRSEGRTRTLYGRLDKLLGECKGVEAVGRVVQVCRSLDIQSLWNHWVKMPVVLIPHRVQAVLGLSSDVMAGLSCSDGDCVRFGEIERKLMVKGLGVGRLADDDDSCMEALEWVLQGLAVGHAWVEYSKVFGELQVDGGVLEELQNVCSSLIERLYVCKLFNWEGIVNTLKDGVMWERKLKILVDCCVKLEIGVGDSVYCCLESGGVELLDSVVESIRNCRLDLESCVNWITGLRKRDPVVFRFDVLYRNIGEYGTVAKLLVVVLELLEKCNDQGVLSTLGCWIASWVNGVRYVERGNAGWCYWVGLLSRAVRVIGFRGRDPGLEQFRHEYVGFLATQLYGNLYRVFVEMSQEGLELEWWERVCLSLVGGALVSVPAGTLCTLETECMHVCDKFAPLVVHGDSLPVRVAAYRVLRKVRYVAADKDLPIVPPAVDQVIRMLVPILEVDVEEDEEEERESTRAHKRALISYLLVWDALLRIQEGSNEFASYVRDQDHLLCPLLNTLFFSPVISIDSAMQKHFDVDPVLVPGQEIKVLHLACGVLQRALRNLPYTVRWWWNNHVTKQRDRVFVEKFVVKHLSSRLADEELRNAQIGDSSSEDNNATERNVTVHCHSGCNELVAHYRIEETNVTLTISLPLNHPLGPVQLKVSDKKLHAKISHLLNSRSHSLSAGLKLWKETLDSLYKDVDECAICFFILHHVTKQTPKLACKTCRKKFHAACLYKWFSTSNKSECPLCRNLF